MYKARPSRLAWLRKIFDLQRAGLISDAERMCESLLRTVPDDPEVLHTAGILAGQRSNWTVALQWFRKSESLRPSEPRYCNSVAVALWRMGRSPEALRHIEQSLERFPRDPALLLHRAKLLEDAGGMSTLKGILAALAVRADDRSLLLRAASLSKRLFLLKESAGFWRRLANLDPQNGAVINNLANVLTDEGRIPEGLSLFRAAARMSGGGAAAGSNGLLTMHYGSSERPNAIRRAHVEWASGIEIAASVSPRRRNVKKRALRVGYVSGDFRQHAVAYFFEPLLRKHDASRIEVHCFSNSPQEDKVTARMRKLVAGWHEIAGKSDDAAAEVIRRAGIDVLVDLSGHTANNRLPLFALRAAPLQVTYLGYPNTTGMRSIDYRFTDSIADPPGWTEHLHSEKLVRLDPCFLSFRPLMPRLPVGPSPFLKSGELTLACFAIRPKLNPRLLAVWAKILQSHHGARLLLKCAAFGDLNIREEVAAFFEGHGVPRRRIELLPRSASMREHLELYQRADLMLDPYPYNGTTMTCEASWMGVPTLTWAGRTHVARVGASILSQLDLKELIASSAQSYVNKAVALMAQPERLEAWRRGLRSRMRRSCLGRPDELVKNIEDAYFKMSVGRR